ncbi:MAG: glucose 1-dehydrogenase [Solirubrobacterales bacterium]|nr:glucose 1-dehydrogenase [Solirubrobacterales bacterium]
MPILDRFRLDGKVAIVTGASSGFGVGIARALAEAGADVALGARRVDRLDATRELVERAGRRAIAVGTDIADPEACQALADATVERLGRADILVNNAGVATAIPALRESPEDFRAVIDVNLLGSYWMAQAAARAMSDGGSIVNVSSITAIHSLGLPHAAYASSKGGLLALTRDLAQQWTGRRRIRVNAVVPGLFATEMTADYVADRAEADQVPRIPVGRLGEVEELAAAVLFLAGDAASYITGEALVVDGGRTII